MTEKHYPFDPALLELDKGTRVHGEKLCATRIDHQNTIVAGTAITWCTLPVGHGGQCSGPLPRELAPTQGYALRLRGLANDQFADRFAERSVRKEPK